MVTKDSLIQRLDNLLKIIPVQPGLHPLFVILQTASTAVRCKYPSFSNA